MVTHQLPSTHNSRYTSYNHHHRRRRDAICSTCTYIYVRFFSWRSLSGAWYWSSSSHHHQVADSSTTLELPTEGSAWIGEGPAVQLSHLGGGLQEMFYCPPRNPSHIPLPKKPALFESMLFRRKSREPWDMEEPFPAWRVSGTAGDPKVGISCWWNSNLGRECQFFGDTKDAGRLSQWGGLRPYFVCWCCYSYFCVGSPGVS